jgi:transposase
LLASVDAKSLKSCADDIEDSRRKTALYDDAIAAFGEGRDRLTRFRRRSLRQQRELILNYFRAQRLISSGVVEGLNNKAKVSTRKSYAFRTYRVPEQPSIMYESED